MTMKITKILPVGLLLLVFPVLKAQTTPIYTYSVPTGGYAPNGSLMNYTDSVNGTWAMRYDNLNRLQSAAATAGPYQSLSLQLQYDSFGNRLNQAPSGSPSASVPSAWATYGANNQMVTSNMAPGGGILYDAAGNMTFDGVNQLLYDAENRVCAAYNSNTGSITQYLYNAEGQRVAKGHPAVSTTTLACPTGSGDFTPTETYILGQSGEQVTQLDGSGHWQHTNVYAAGQLLATYDDEVLPQKQSVQLLHFNLSDPLGTKRVQTSSAGVVESTCTNLPFGEGPSCVGATEHFFTGKERDSESGLDYFGARHYSSNMGRFMSPDWSDSPDPVPWANINNPQSLNLYAYVGNNPLSRVDDDGHDGALPTASCSGFLCWLRHLLNGSGEAVSGANSEIGNTFTGAGNFVDRQINGGRHQEPLQPITGSAQKSGATVAGIGMLFVPGPEEAEGVSLAEKWGPGTFENVGKSLSWHFGKHGAELGAESLLQYLRKADQFAANLQRSKAVPLGDGSVKYIKNGRYIIKSIEGKILSFGLVGQ